MSSIKQRIQFSTPIFECEIENFESKKSDIIREINSLASNGPSVSRSNIGGWHSDYMLHRREENEVLQWLVQKIVVGSTAMISEYYVANGLLVPPELDMTQCWANINPKHTWNSPHHHSPSDWSGVAYIATTDESKEVGEAIAGGDIIFFDPAGVNHQFMKGPTVNFTPSSGSMLLFPGNLLHMVAPHSQAVDRISIAFNFRLRRSTIDRS